MLGTHDSYTFLKARYKVFELFSFMWRTQTKSILQQKQNGTRYFDIRIRRNNNKWRVCHGLVDFNLTYSTIKDIVDAFNGYNIRIILERGNGRELFIRELEDYKSTNSPIKFACIKKNWEIIIDNDLPLFDFTYIPWYSNLSFIENIKRFNFLNTIKRWANKHNPIITADIIHSDDKIYFIDRL